MIAVIALAGLALGTLLSAVILRQLPPEHSLLGGRAGWPAWIPVAGAIRHRDWVGLVVELLTAAMAVVLWRRYGLSARTLSLLLASLVLIETGAVDFHIRMI